MHGGVFCCSVVGIPGQRISERPFLALGVTLFSLNCATWLLFRSCKRRSRRPTMASRAPPRAALAGATFNLLNTILGGGGGIVPLPRCVKLMGLRLAPLLLVLCAALSTYSACTIVAVATAVHSDTYQGIARRTIGARGALVVQVLVVSLTFGISVALFSIFADVAMVHCSRSTAIVLAGVMVTPIVALVRRIERLAVISVVASALVVAFVGFVCAHHHSNPSQTPPMLELSPPSWSGLLEAVSIVNLSFLCHFNLLPLFYGLRHAHDAGGGHSLTLTPPHAISRSMYGVIAFATLLALLVYASVGVAGYLAFGVQTSGNAFADYASTGHVGHALNNALAGACADTQTSAEEARKRTFALLTPTQSTPVTTPAQCVSLRHLLLLSTPWYGAVVGCVVRACSGPALLSPTARA